MLEDLNRAVEHIDQHLDDELDVAALARIALTSEHHFRRMFSALAGMPLSEYIRRRRLTLAGAEVLSRKGTLLDIAVRAGYGSTEAFNRAFRAMHGVTPREARESGAVLSSQPRLLFRLVIEGRSEMRYRIVEKEAFRLVGLGTQVTLVHEGANPALAQFIKGIGHATLARMEALSDQEPRGVIGATSNLDAARAEGSSLDYFHGVATSADPPADLEVMGVAAGMWAVFDSAGPFPQAIQFLWRDVFTQWFPSSPYQSRPGPEMLQATVSADGTQAEAQLWIPVELR